MAAKMRTWYISLLVIASSCWSPASAATCGGTYTEASGNFSSPNYPSAYPNRADCDYSVLASPDARTDLTCKCSLQGIKGCTKDYIRLGNTLYCASKCPKGLVIEGSFVLKFHSDAKKKKKGFQCWFTRISGGDYIETTTTSMKTTTTTSTRTTTTTSTRTTTSPSSSLDSCSSVVGYKNSWNEGWSGWFEIPIEKDISGWTLDVTFDKDIRVFEVWNADIAASSSSSVSLTPKHYIANQTAGSTLKFDFLYRFPRDSSVPSIISVKFNGEELCGKVVTVATTTSPPVTSQSTSTSTSPPSSSASPPSSSTEPPSSSTTTGPVASTTTTPGSSTTCTNVKYNYDQVLHKSLLFYEAQRSGDLPESQRVKWRKDSALGDAKDDATGQIDLEGGYYDAGDYVKFGFPMAGATTVLAWGAIENRKAYEDAGEWKYMKEAVKWATDYFIKAHVEPFVFYGQVGLGDLDHSYWGRPEDMTMRRPAFKITKDKPGSELAGETAAALAAASILFRDSDSAYADLCLKHAKELYVFADKYRGKYSDSIPDAGKFYKNWGGYGDELAWAAVWLYRATEDASYLDAAKNHYGEFGLNKLANEFSWDEKTPGVQVLLAEYAKDSTFVTAITNFCNNIINNKPRTPKGLVFISQWGSLRYASNAVFICLRAADLGINSKTYKDFAQEQIHYMLGDAGRSFVVGFGNNPPQRPHHRSSSCPSAPASCDQYKDSPDPNPHVLEGALVGGPDQNDYYEDRRNDYVKNEVACDYNAGFQSAVAELRRLYCA